MDRTEFFRRVAVDCAQACPKVPASAGEASYVPLVGEGEVRIVRRTRVRHECHVCGEPASYRHTYLLQGARRNPASSAYGRDDCSWCSDAESFVCEEHKGVRERPDGMEWAGTFTLAAFPHMGLYWRDELIETTGA